MSYIIIQTVLIVLVIFIRYSTNLISKTVKTCNKQFTVIKSLCWFLMYVNTQVMAVLYTILYVGDNFPDA